MNRGTCLAAISPVTASDAANPAMGATTRAGGLQIAKAVEVDSSDLHDRGSTSFANLRQLGTNNFRENVMGKYFLAWLLGVPGGILLLIFLFTHVF